MTSSPYLYAVLFQIGLSSVAYLRASRIASSVQGESSLAMHSQPSYHGYYVALWVLIPITVCLFLSTVFPALIAKGAIWSDLRSMYPGASRVDLELAFIRLTNSNIANGFSAPGGLDLKSLSEVYHLWYEGARDAFFLLAMATGLGGYHIAASQIDVRFPARKYVEKLVLAFLFISASIAVLTTVGIIFSLVVETYHFFRKVPLAEFLFGTKWSPQIAMRSDQVASSGAFGAVPLFVGTLLISAIALLVAVPVGLFCAVYLTEYASKTVRAYAKPALEVLAGIPTVVYGFFAALTVAPFFRGIGDTLGLSVSSESALAAGLVMGVMIIPFVSSLSDDIINAVPQRLRDGSLALGATRSETMRKVVFPAALPGLVGAFLLAASRAVGETMIVVMAAGLAANLTVNPLDNVTTVTVQIVTILVGDQEFDSAKTLAAFALGMMLFLVTLIFNAAALYIVKKFQEKYD